LFKDVSVRASITFCDFILSKLIISPYYKPYYKTESCQVTHRQYVMSGRVRVKMNDGSEEKYGPGDVTYIPPGHNAWVVGNEPYTGIDFGTVDMFSKNYVAAP
jgi:hypothetical protein